MEDSSSQRSQRNQCSPAPTYTTALSYHFLVCELQVNLINVKGHICTYIQPKSTYYVETFNLLISENLSL